MRYRKNIKGGKKKDYRSEGHPENSVERNSFVFGGGIVCGKYPDRVCKYRKIVKKQEKQRQCRS